MKALAILAAVVGVVAVGCGGDPECAKTDRDGTYLTTLTVASGDCGSVPSFLVQMDKGQSGATPGCTVGRSTYSEDECKYESQTTCLDTVERLKTITVGITEQQDDDGEEISGTLSFTITDLDTGAYVCMGTYNATYVRQ